MLSNIFETFVEESPVTVMATGLMAHVFATESIDAIFERYAQVQFQQTLMFSSVVDLMSLVVCGIHPSVNAAYRAKAKEMTVTSAALYKKLQGVEPVVSRGLLRETYLDLAHIREQWQLEDTSLIPGYRWRILDGCALASTDHRLESIRYHAAKALPGKVIAVLDPQQQLVSDVFPCVDGHAQERSLLKAVLETVEAGQIWIGDRNFCTKEFLSGVEDAQSYFIIRYHKSLNYDAEQGLRSSGKVETGKVLSQKVEIKDLQCHSRTYRLVVVRLLKPTRDGDAEIAILTNIPESVAADTVIAEAYRTRWRIETLFQTITANFHGEISSLAYPQAAIFSFCLALVSYNILSTVRAAMSSVHGCGKIESGLSDYYLVEEIHSTYRGMMIALPAPVWEPYAVMSHSELAKELSRLALRVSLSRFRKTPRGAKKPRPPLIVDGRNRHISTARALDGFY